ncbi:helix-turn-helix transcriptional regulator (plasmid) [Rhizobium leguminosarum bv. viciae 248]|uniref:helix-turn-helix domain-containing protein n=1 Tax=Rhizobium leguminosarum TaxID=384 RepID=UPI0013970575|nr:AraC family transcriptional regulator [Rhizobium leguminosarum]NKL78461.1 helix-turn-helix domain-containing protein [Rhizobium leguminosarum bv. viciae]MBY5818594.1 helix-turn-helix transcriptional regulator [Rhizobium leguminosarum]MBY5838524.1 helix-turn-helix transcriptional regulator [Rhizobium leguminosarum]MBY5868035.1 helix-turn-helix transcriptional regulator [Rhizobium leguminosarum]MCA2410352.1 AraC family transcriptional regulator [Rhizobium leguminosarum]
MSFKPLLGDGRIRSQEERSEPLQTASWAGSSIVFDNRRWACREAELRWTAPHHLVVLTEEGGTSQTSIRHEAKSVYDGKDRPGALTFVPAGAERFGFYRNVDLTYSALWIDPDARISGCESLGDLPILVNKKDPVIATLVGSLRDEMALGHKPDTAYVEHLVALVGLRVATLNKEHNSVQGHGCLSRRALGRVRDYIDAHMNSDISLSALAAVADMAVDSFARRFKATTGLAPYAYVIEERVWRAETLLRETGLSIGTIAFRLGFSSQSHFTTTFRRLRGMTPRVYRMHFSPGS